MKLSFNARFSIYDDVATSVGWLIYVLQKSTDPNKSFLLFPKNSSKNEKRLNTFNQYLLQFKENGRYRANFKGLQPKVSPKLAFIYQWTNSVKKYG